MTAPRERTVPPPAGPDDWKACRERMDRILGLTRELSERIPVEGPERLDVLVAERGRLLVELSGALTRLRPALASGAAGAEVRTALAAWERDMEQHGEELVRRLRDRKQQTLDTLSTLQRARKLERYTH